MKNKEIPSYIAFNYYFSSLLFQIVVFIIYSLTVVVFISPKHTYWRNERIELDEEIMFILRNDQATWAWYMGSSVNPE